MGSLPRLCTLQNLQLPLQISLQHFIFSDAKFPIQNYQCKITNAKFPNFPLQLLLQKSCKVLKLHYIPVMQFTALIPTIGEFSHYTMSFDVEEIWFASHETTDLFAIRRRKAHWRYRPLPLKKPQTSVKIEPADTGRSASYLLSHRDAEGCGQGL